MRKFGLFMLVMFVVVLAGCVGSDKVMGVEKDADGNPVRKEGPAPINILGEALGLGGLAAAARWIYTEARIRKVDKNVKALVAGVEDAVKSGKVDKSIIYPTITEAAKLYSNRDYFAKSVGKIKVALRNMKDKKPAA